MELSEYIKKYPKLSNKEILKIYKDDKELHKVKTKIKSKFNVGDYWLASNSFGKVLSIIDDSITKSVCYVVSDNSIEKKVINRFNEVVNGYVKIDNSNFDTIEKRFESILNVINSIKILDKFNFKKCLSQYTIESFMVTFPNVLGENVFDEMDKKNQNIRKTNELKNKLNLKEAPIGATGICEENKFIFYVKGIDGNVLTVDVIDYSFDKISFVSNFKQSIILPNEFKKIDINFYGLVAELSKPF